MKIFELVNYELTIDPIVFTLKPFADIKKKYKDRDLLYGEMAFIFYYADWRSDYSSIIDDEERKEKILSELYIDRNKLVIDESTFLAIEFYNDRQETLSMLLYKDARFAINKIREYLRTVDLMKVDENDKPIHDVVKLTKTIESSATIVDKMVLLEESIKKEKQANTKIRGIDKVGLFEQ
jgi:hypothetical protein